MSTLVTFHAHPDDEAIATGGTMAKAARAGHRVVLVVATRGERGEVAEGHLQPGEELWQRRVEETQAAAAVLGVSRVEFLGYVDSGMAGMPTNDDPASFWQADVEEAARRLADILEEEGADVVTAYDENGVYGHPDHVQVYLGVPGDRITTTVDVVEFLDVKRKAMGSHASQIAETSFFLSMHPEMFRIAFGQEWYILVDAPPGTVETDLFAGL